MTVTITVEQLQNLDACGEQVQEFEQEFGSVLIIESEAQAKLLGKKYYLEFDFDWASKSLLTGKYLDKYREIEQSALDRYREIVQPALDRYREIEQPAWAKYLEIKQSRQPSWDKYLEVEQPAWAKYLEVQQSAWDKYEEIEQPALDKHRQALAIAFITQYFEQESKS